MAVESWDEPTAPVQESFILLRAQHGSQLHRPKASLELGVVVDRICEVGLKSHARLGRRDGYIDDPAAGQLTAVEVRVAEPGPLIAMKLQNLANRPSAKEATDLLDVSQLLRDH